jgi:aspartyl-tRNA(Asn)/glutamyl-tRNA(Gln) amidotransferase subunit A
MSVADAALMLNVLSLADARDWTALPYDARDYTEGLNDGVRGLRIAWSPTLGHATVDAEVAAACARGVAKLAELGAVVEAVDPGFEDPIDIATGLWFLGAWTVWNGLTPQQQAVADPDFAAQAQAGSTLSALAVQQLHLRRGALGSLMRQFMERFDVLVTPHRRYSRVRGAPGRALAMDARRCSGGRLSPIRST